jgi:formate hydrogenlyase subunit 3/multisubunit Na+/H+ antiporter MnhD subunit
MMTATAGFLGALQRHLGRILGYAAIAETGLLLAVLGLRSIDLINIVFLILIPRGLELSIWALALSIIKRKAYPLKFSDVQGMARTYPVATGALIIAHLSMAGFPLLGGFPPRLALWQELSALSTTASFWIFLGMVGVLVSAIRSLATLVMANEDTPWEWNETWIQTIMLIIGVFGLFLLGVFPQALQPFINSLPALFEHLAQ